VYVLYNLAIYVTSLFLPIIAFFSTKVNLFINGRKNVFRELKKHITEKDSTIWIHAASLGEYEQGLPIVEKLKAEYPSFKIVVSFFSPSGYEVIKDTTKADLVTYLPLDTKNNTKRFIKHLQPKVAIFIKYEIWPNMLKELHKSGIPILLISAIFKSDQIYFKWYGGFMRNALQKFSHFFIQDSKSLKLLNSIGMDNTTISGDTRFDRVSEILQQDNSLEFMDSLTQNYLCFVMGSTWSEDEEILVDYINASSHEMKYVIAPHRIIPKDIERFQQSINKHSVLLSESSDNFSGEPQVLIVDRIGLLTKIYSYADIAYVGGAFLKGGLHNTLEPAVFGIPVIIGPNYEGFKEAEGLVKLNGIFPVRDKAEFTKLADKLILDSNFRGTAGDINVSYINKNKGASIQVMNHIRTLL
jgi:3-deoxy-D-manno-octulosonic-acid transferase